MSDDRHHRTRLLCWGASLASDRVGSKGEEAVVTLLPRCRPSFFASGSIVSYGRTDFGSPCGPIRRLERRCVGGPRGKASDGVTLEAHLAMYWARVWPAQRARVSPLHGWGWGGGLTTSGVEGSCGHRQEQGVGWHCRLSALHVG